MALTFPKSGTAFIAGTAGTTLTPVFSGGATATAGKFLLSCIGIDKNSGTITPPAGWTVLNSLAQTDVSYAWAFKIAAGGETGAAWSWGTAQLATAWVGEADVLDNATLDQKASATSGINAIKSQTTGTTPATTKDGGYAIAWVTGDSGGNMDLAGGDSWTNAYSQIFNIISSNAGAPPIKIAVKDPIALGAQAETTYVTTDAGDQMAAAIAVFVVAPAGVELTKAVGDTLAPSETMVGAVSQQRGVADAIAPLESVTPSQSLSRIAGDAMAPTEAAATSLASTISRNVGDVLAPTEKVSAEKPLALTWGVNLAGGEFAETTMPGVLDTHYTYPTAAEMTYYGGKGIKVIRVPFRWERVEINRADAALNETDMARLDTVISDAAANGMQVLLDMHNYGRRREGGVDLVLGTDIPYSDFADVWTKIANRYKANANIFGYGLMNEPNNMPTASTWPDAAQAAVNGIRTVDTLHRIFVCGDHWGGAHSWRTTSNENLAITDSGNNLIYEAHQYFDANSSGKYAGTYDAEGATPTIGVTRVQPFLDWCAEKNVQGYIGEYGIPRDDDRWYVVMDNFIEHLKANGMGSSYWAGGPWWPETYLLSIEPTNNLTVDRPQMDVLEAVMAGVQTILKQLNDSLAPTETVAIQRSLSRSIVDVLSPTESAIGAIGVILSRTIGDVLAPLDGQSTPWPHAGMAWPQAGAKWPQPGFYYLLTQGEQIVGDTLSPTEAVAVSRNIARSVNDGYSPTESVVSSSSIARLLNDTLSPLEAVSRGTILQREITDTLSPVESVSRLVALLHSIGDTISPVEAASKIMSLHRSIGETLSPVESTAYALQILRLLADSVSPTEAAIVGSIQSRLVGDAISPTESMTAGAGATLHRSIYDVLAPVDLVNREIVLRRVLTDLLSPTENVSQYVFFALPSDKDIWKVGRVPLDVWFGPAMRENVWKAQEQVTTWIQR